MEKLVDDDGSDQGSHLLQADLEIKSLKTASVFLTEIERIKRENDLPYIDCVIHYCESNGIEVEAVGALIKNIPLLKAKIQDEAESLNFLPKTAKLPLDTLFE